MRKTSRAVGAITTAEVPAVEAGGGAVGPMSVEPVGRAERPTGPPLSAPAPVVGVIPVGGEPPRQPRVEGDDTPVVTGQPPQGDAAAGRRATAKRRDKDGNTRPPLRNPDGFYRYKNRLDELQVFREETMRHLRRAEIGVWLAIHGCQHDGAAQIGQTRIAELAGITGKRHVVEAVEDLCNKGLLEVLSQGRYRPNGADGHGLSSVYRAYPRPEPRLLNSAPDGEISPGGGCSKKPAVAKPVKPRKPR